MGGMLVDRPGVVAERARQVVQDLFFAYSAPGLRRVYTGYTPGNIAMFIAELEETRV
jgi:hypothetical protein